jgi:hypothetical protein
MNYEVGIDVAFSGNFCHISPPFGGAPLDPASGSGYHGEVAHSAAYLICAIRGMPPGFPYWSQIWKFATGIFLESVGGAYRWTTQANWIYANESDSENAVGTIVSLFGIAVTLTLALGVAVWGTATAKYTIDENDKISRTAEVSFDDDPALHRKMSVYATLSVAILLVLFRIVRMRSSAGMHAGQFVHRWDRASVRFGVLMLCIVAFVNVGASLLVLAGDFPGERGPTKVIVRPYPYRFILDQTEGFRIVVPYVVPKEEEGQYRTTVTVPPEINRVWEIAGVEGYRPAAPPIDPKSWEDPTFQPPSKLRLGEGPYIQEDGGPKVTTSELTFFGVQAQTEYTLVFRFHARNGMSPSSSEAVKFLHDHPTSFKVN